MSQTLSPIERRKCIATSSLYRISRMGGGLPGGLGGTFYIGEIKIFAFFQTRKFSKNVKRINEKFTILRKFSNLHTKISIENWFFIHFLSHLPGLLSFYTPLEHTKIFFGWLGRVLSSWGGRGGCINPCLLISDN